MPDPVQMGLRGQLLTENRQAVELGSLFSDKNFQSLLAGGNNWGIRQKNE